MKLKKSQLIEMLLSCTTIKLVNYYDRYWDNGFCLKLWEGKNKFHNIIIDLKTLEWAFK